MIDSLVIENFQSHKFTQLNFDPGVNVILGATDAGKSAIFRALVWVLFNRPLGNDFRSYWGGTTSVQVDFNDENDSSILQRVKSNKENYYDLNGDEFKAFGQEPPDEVLQAHNIDRTLNVQSQIDPFFLLQSSPGEVAQHFNRIARLDDIDRVSKNIDSHARKLQKDLAQGKNYLAEMESELEEYSHLGKVKKELDRAEQIEKKIDKAKRQKRTVIRLCEDIEKTKKKIEQREHQIQIKPFVESALHLQKTQAVARDRQNKVLGIIKAIKALETQISRKKSQLEKDKSKFHKAMPSTCPLCGQKVKGES